MKVVHLDTETASPVDPKKTSFDHLAKNCTPDVLTWGVAPDFHTMPEVVHAWDARANPTPPAELMTLLNDPTNWFVAFNSGFDEIVVRTWFGIHYPNNWLDSGVAAACIGYSVGKLEDLAKVMKCKHQKIELYPGLMKLFSGATLYGKAKSFKGRNLYTSDGSVDQEYYAELRQHYIDYAIKDTWTSAEIFTTCMRDYPEPYPIDDWLLHQRMNQRGLGVDREFLTKMIALNAALKAVSKDRLRELCNVDYEVASHPGFSKWLAEMIPDWDKGSAGDIILPLAAQREQKYGKDDLIATACRLKASALGTANAKFTKLLSMTDETDRTYNALRFNGAAQTGRPSGSGFQALNMARPYSPKGTNYPMKKSSDAYKAADMPVTEWLERYGYDAADVAAKIIRAALVPATGHKFVDFDFSGIESNAIMSMTQDPEGIRIRREKLDGYIAFAVRQTGLTYDEIVADKAAGGTIRQDNKPAVLGCFAAGTQVLTDSGYKPIERIGSTDTVWNGEAFCPHEGVIDQGVKAVIKYDGIEVTGDHLFLVKGEWVAVNTLTTVWIHDQVRTYDLLNVEQGNRYTVKGDTQTHIVHNCGYGMSGPALLTYAQGMGVYKPLSFWTGAVDTWRTAHAGVVESWDLLDKLFHRITESPVGSVLPLSTLLPHFPSTLERHSNGVCLRHPCGRGIWFRDARMEWTNVPYVDKETGEAKSFKAYSMTYLHNQGKKTWRESLYGGKALAVNTQSLCNSLLRDWMRNIDEVGLQIVLQVYDQVLVEVPTPFAEYAVEKITQAVPGRKDPTHWSAPWDVQIDGGVLDRFWK